jgi:hypothetical protein
MKSSFGRDQQRRAFVEIEVIEAGSIVLSEGKKKAIRILVKLNSSLAN